MIQPDRVALRQQRDLGQIIDATIKLYSQNFPVLFTIAALVIPLGIAAGIFQTISNDVTGSIVISLISLGQAVVNLVAGSAVIIAVNDLDQNRAPEFGRSFDEALARVGTLVMSLLRAAFHVILFAITIVGIPWAIQRAIRWVFIQQTVMIEGASWDQALGKSADVVLGSWWRTLGIWLLITILAAVPVALARGAFVFAPVLVSSIVGSLLEALVLPFVAIGTTLLYFDLKTRKETEAIVTPPAGA